MVIYIETVIRGEKNGVAAADGAMLHRVVEHYYVQRLQLPLELFDAPYAVLADRHGHLGGLTMQLHPCVLRL